LINKEEGKEEVVEEEKSTLIVDESSMVNDALFDFLNKFKNELGVKIIYLGDPAQLKPVKSKGLSKVFDSGKQFALTIVERTGDNPILEESTNLRNGKDFNYQTKMVGDEGVEYIKLAQEVNRIIGENYASVEFETDKLFFRILAAKNDKVKEYNEIARRVLHNTNEQLIVGDVLMGYDNFDVDYETKEPVIINSGDYQVVALKKGVKQVRYANKTVEYNGYFVTLENLLNPSDSTKNVFVVDNKEDSVKVFEFIDAVSALNIAGAQLMKAGQRQQAAGMFSAARALQSQLAFMKSLTDANGKLKVKKTLDYGYAHTIHKSQGGTYSKVLIIADTISSPFSLQEQQQLKYVAMSRASKNVYVLTNGATKEEVQEGYADTSLSIGNFIQGEPEITDTDIDMINRRIAGEVQEDLLPEGKTMKDLVEELKKKCK